MDNTMPYPATPHLVRVTLARVQDHLDTARESLDGAMDGVDAIATWLRPH
ncbi:MAG: hypothetical protein ACRC35_03150 [Angustibacter sp.]